MFRLLGSLIAKSWFVFLLGWGALSNKLEGDLP